MGIVEYLSDSDNFIAIVGIVLTFIFGIAAIYFYYRPQKIKYPCYAIRNTNLIRDLVGKFGGLEILFSGNKIENLTATKVAFWNGGKETIDVSDMAPADPLGVFIVRDFEILDVKLIFFKNPVNEIKLELSNDHKFVKILFDYLDQNEGCVIQVLHTGKNSQDIGVQGTIKGVKELAFITSNPVSHGFNVLSRLFMISAHKNKFSKFFGILFILTPIIFGGILLLTENRDVNLLILVMFTLFLAIPYWLIAFLTLKRKIPKGYDILEDEV